MLKDAIQCHLMACVETPYELRFCKSVLEWAAGIIELAGGSQKETSGILLALEETLLFIINAYPDAENWELLRVGIKLMTDGTTEVSVSNAGPPVHLDKIPTYDPENPASSDLDGLWFFLAKKMVDDLAFKNLGMKGWLVVIKKKLSSPCYDTSAIAESSENSGRDKRSAFTSRLATPEDAGDLMDLTFDTYRYSYPGEEFYHKSKLIKAIKSGAMDSIVVEADGNIIANTTIAVDPKTPQCGYLGTLMVRRAFRGTRAIMVMIQEAARYIESNRLGVDLYYGTMVTEHAASQKAAAKVGLHPLALLLGVGAAVDYRGMSIEEGTRETFLLCSRLSVPPQLRTIFLPERHHNVMRPLLDQLGCSAELTWDSSDTPAGDTSFTVLEDEIESSASITIDRLGKHWADQLRKGIFQLTTRQIRSIIIYVPAWRQPPSDIDNEMAKLNAIFTGIKPVSASRYYLVYCALFYTVEFDHIKLAAPTADALNQHVMQLYQETF